MIKYIYPLTTYILGEKLMSRYVVLVLIIHTLGTYFGNKYEDQYSMSSDIVKMKFSFLNQSLLSPFNHREQQRNFSYCLTEYRFETRHLQKFFNPLSTSNSMSPPQRSSINLGRDIGSNKQALFRGIFRRFVCPICIYLNNLKNMFTT